MRAGAMCGLDSTEAEVAGSKQPLSASEPTSAGLSPLSTSTAASDELALLRKELQALTAEHSKVLHRWSGLLGVSSVSVKHHAPMITRVPF